MGPTPFLGYTVRMNSIWPRCIALSDQNCFFAAIEQRDFPKLQGKPVCVTNGMVGTTIITSSYEARAFGIKTGMRIQEARKLCPHLIQRGTRPKIYAEVSTAIMDALALHVTDRIEVFSVDEAFLDLTSSQRLLGTPEQMGALIKKTVFNASGLYCSVGISTDKTIAKYAAKQKKPDGLTIIPPDQVQSVMQHVPVEQLCGIGPGLKVFLNARGVHTCGDMQKIPISVLAERFGNVGRRIWLMAQGLDPEPVKTSINAPKSIGHGKVLPPKTKDKKQLLMYYQHMSERVAARLRKHGMVVNKYFIGWQSYDDAYGSIVNCSPTNDGKLIFELCKKMLDAHWNGQSIFSIQVTAIEPHADVGQADLFSTVQTQKQENKEINKAIDAINSKFGKNMVRKGLMIDDLETPDVISPAWKPSGHRQTIN